METTDEDEKAGLNIVDFEFQQLLDSTIVDIYPEVLQRVRSAQFTGWQRRLQIEEDVAHQACAEFYAQCMKNGSFPNAENLLAYVVQIAINIANRQYTKHIQEAEFLVDPEDQVLGELFSSSEDEDRINEYDKHLRDLKREDRLLTALSSLTPRNREAFELRMGNPSLTYAELGSQMSISEDGFRKNFQRACDALEVILNPNRKT